MAWLTAYTDADLVEETVENLVQLRRLQFDLAVWPPQFHLLFWFLVFRRFRWLHFRFIASRGRRWFGATGFSRRLLLLIQWHCSFKLKRVGPTADNTLSLPPNLDHVIEPGSLRRLTKSSQGRVWVKQAEGTKQLMQRQRHVTTNQATAKYEPKIEQK